MILLYFHLLFKMKVLCIGDIHVKVSNVPEIDEMTDKLINLTKERRPDFIVIMGDVLDRHATIHVSCLMRAEKIVLELSKLAPTFVLVGNHDRPNNSNFLTDEHPFNAMKLWPNTYIIDKVYSYIFSMDQSSSYIQVREDNLANSDEYRFIFAPYVPPKRFMEALNTLNTMNLPTTDENSVFDKTSAIFAHQEIINAKMGAFLSTEGDEWPLSNPLLISGHIHDYDNLQPNMIYVGVPLMHSFGDRPDKTVSLFTFNSKNNCNINCNNSEWNQERIDLGLIKKTTIYLTAEQLINYSPNNPNDTKDTKDKMVKLVVKGDEAEIKTIAKLDKIQELKKIGVKVVFKTVQSKVQTNSKILPKMSFRERLLSEISENETFWFNKIFHNT